MKVLALWLSRTFIHLQYSLDVKFFLYYVDLLYKLAVREEFLKPRSRLLLGTEVVYDQALGFLIAIAFDKHHFFYIEEVGLAVGEVGLADDRL